MKPNYFLFIRLLRLCHSVLLFGCLLRGVIMLIQLEDHTQKLTTLPSDWGSIMCLRSRRCVRC